MRPSDMRRVLVGGVVVVLFMLLQLALSSLGSHTRGRVRGENIPAYLPRPPPGCPTRTGYDCAITPDGVRLSAAQAARVATTDAV